MLRERQTKEEFVKETTKRIELRKSILDFVNNVYFPLMKEKFDGKVYNKRFINALREKAEEINPLFSVKEKVYDHIEIQLRLKPWNYNEYESMYVKCNLTSDGRIDYESTINDKMGQNWLDSFAAYCDEYQAAIDNYDEYLKAAERMEQAVREYNETIPFAFRKNMDTTYIRVY